MSTGIVYPWDDPAAPVYVRERAAKLAIGGQSGVRGDLPRRRPADELSPTLARRDVGIVVMTHRGYSNGRLSVCLSSIPENYDVTVCTDAIDERDAIEDGRVASYHGATAYFHTTPWAGRAGNAIACMERTHWAWTLFLCDDVWLFPEAVSDALRWAMILQTRGVPLASLALPRYETYREHRALGFATWAQCLAEPWRYESLPPVPSFTKTPALFLNPFGGAMLIYRPAFLDVGGFSHAFWAHDDVLHYRTWTSGRWVNACYPGRGFTHLGAQSWHEGETDAWTGTYEAATGVSVEEGERQMRAQQRQWAARIGEVFESLGGQAAV